jgi:hypothetical protein
LGHGDIPPDVPDQEQCPRWADRSKRTFGAASARNHEHFVTKQLLRGSTLNVGIFCIILFDSQTQQSDVTGGDTDGQRRRCGHDYRRSYGGELHCETSKLANSGT